MPKSKSKTHGAMIAEEMNHDSDFRREWEATELARVVAAQLIEYRSDHGLTQRALAEKLGKRQPFIAKLESGEANPHWDTLVHISRTLGIEFMIDIAPPEKQTQRKFVTKALMAKADTQEGAVVAFAAQAR